MGVIEKMKNCEGCRKRRKFLKEFFVGIAAATGMAFLLPSGIKAQLNCECQHCTNGDICLCCDPFCDHCSISSRVRCCVHVLEFCDGVPTYTAICCANGTCPGMSKTEDDKLMKNRWKIILDNSTEYILLSSDENLDAEIWLKKHSASFKNQNGKTVKVVTVNKLL